MPGMVQFHLKGGRVIQYDESGQYDVVFADGRFFKHVLEDLCRAYEEENRESKISVMVTVRDKQGGKGD